MAVPVFARSVVGINGVGPQQNFTVAVANVSGYVLTIPQVSGPAYRDYGSPIARIVGGGMTFTARRGSMYLGVI